MIQNRLYLGEIMHKEKVNKGQHDAIVVVDVFDQAQRVIEGNAKNRRGPPLRALHEYPLTGVTHCACGYAMTTSAGRSSNGTLYFYYRCVGMNMNVDHPCEVKQINAEVLEAAVFGVVRDAARDPDVLAQAVAEVNRLAAESVAPVRARVEALRRDLAAAEDEGKRVLRQVLTTGVADIDFARTLLAEIEERRNGLR